MSTIRFSREIPVRYDVDVFVAGGGPAGLAAAIAAARRGTRVYLAEGQGCLGGSGTAGLLPTFCHFTDLEHFVAGGVGREVYDRLFDYGGNAPCSHRANPHGAVHYKVEVLKRIYDDLLIESGAAFTFHTALAAVDVADSRVNHVLCQAKSGLFAVRAKIYIDCTGDGDLAAWAGAPFEKGDTTGGLQAPTLCSLWADVDWARAEAAGYGCWQQEKHLARAIEDGVFSIPDLHMPGILPVADHLGGGNIGHLFGVDGTDECSLTEGQVRGRKLLQEYERYFKQYLQGFEEMELVGSGAILGIRETRRIRGDYQLTLDDFVARAVFDDEIGRFAYNVDIHAARPGESEATFEGMRTYAYKTGESYGIPYRCLTPRTLDNVLVAGRCISSDRSINGSLRVMPCSFITGQAAGVAAAMAAEQGVSIRSVDVTGLQRRLLDMGAFLPNAEV